MVQEIFAYENIEVTCRIQTIILCYSTWLEHITCKAEKRLWIFLVRDTSVQKDLRYFRKKTINYKDTLSAI